MSEVNIVREEAVILYSSLTKRPNSCDQRGNDQWEDESFQHPEEDFSDVGDVHHLPLVPVLLTLTEDQSEYDPADDAAHGGDSQGVHPQTSQRFLCSAHPEEEQDIATVLQHRA